MYDVQTKNLDMPDETRTLPETRIDIVNFGDVSLMRLTLEPGWRWSEHVKPSVGTKSCEVAHFNYGISGRVRIRTNDGVEQDVGPGDVMMLAPGHDAWVVGGEPYVGLDFQGARVYGKPATRRDQAPV